MCKSQNVCPEVSVQWKNLQRSLNIGTFIVSYKVNIPKLAKYLVKAKPLDIVGIHEIKPFHGCSAISEGNSVPVPSAPGQPEVGALSSPPFPSKKLPINCKSFCWSWSISSICYSAHYLILSVTEPVLPAISAAAERKQYMKIPGGGGGRVTERPGN